MKEILAQESYLAAKKMLDYAALRQKVLAHNVANINTPGFKRQEVAFTEELSSAMDGGADDILNIDFKVFETDDIALRNDGNNVDIDKEMSFLAQNSFKFSMFADILGDKLSKLKQAITQTT